MAIDLRRLLARQRNLLRGSDPGFNRLRQAASGAGAMASALVPGYLYALAIDADAKVRLVSMLLSALVAMIGSMALTGSRPGVQARTAVFFPVAIGAGMTAGTVLAGNTTALLGVFVLVVFLAVYIRRFGLPFFFYGFMLWIGYFFAAFLHPTVGMLPELIGASAVGAAWVLVLSSTVFRTAPTRALADVRRAFDARAVELIRSCAVMLETPPGRGRRRAERRIEAHHDRLQETALMIEAWSAELTELPHGRTAADLRRRTLEWTLVLDRIAGSARAVAGAPAELTSHAAAMLRGVIRQDRSAVTDRAGAVRRAARTPPPADGAVPEGRLRVAALRLAGAAEEVMGLLESALTPAGGQAPAAPDPAAREDEEFEPAVSLAMGNLPGSPSVAREVAPRTHRWNPVGRLDFTSRQAVQVAVACGLAIWIGRELDATRYYWAVIAAFIAFTGTGSRSETFIKSANRVLGTVTGLVVGIWSAHLTAGHTPLMLAVIILSMFCGLYLVRINYAYMIFFVTIMVSQLYSILHEFSEHLLMLRLEETVIGAACGIAVALVVAPLSTRDTVRHAQASLLSTLADLLDATADAHAQTIRRRGTDGGDRTDGRADAADGEDGEDGEDGKDSEDTEDTEAPRTVAELQVDLDNRLRQLQLVAKPLTRPLLWDNSPRVTRHRLAVYGGVVRTARAAGPALQGSPTATPAVDGNQAADLYRLVAQSARAAAAHPAPLGAGSHPPDGALAEAIRRTEDRIETLAADPTDGLRLQPVSLAARLTELLAATGEEGPVHSTLPPTGERTDSRRAAPAR